MFWATPLPQLERDVIYGWSLAAATTTVHVIIRRSDIFVAPAPVSLSSQESRLSFKFLSRTFSISDSIPLDMDHKMLPRWDYGILRYFQHAAASSARREGRKDGQETRQQIWGKLLTVHHGQGVSNVQYMDLSCPQSHESIPLERLREVIRDKGPRQNLVTLNLISW